MAHGRKARRKKTRLPEIDDVVAGRVELRCEELFALIHRINPTGREVSDAARSRRYGEKARLQSLLIRHFGDQSLVVEGTGEDEIVGLSHRSGTVDACHAVVSELDPDARAWVRRQLDLAALPAEEGSWEDALPTGPSILPHEDAAEEVPPAGVGELLAGAERALAEYDYGTAERDLTRAFELSRGGVEAARLLLDLWVGTLGLDAPALTLASRLAPAATEDPGVRTLLALAAARCGEPERARQLVKGTALPGTVEVYAALAAHAAGAGDPETASRYLDQVVAGDPAHPQIPGLTREIASLRAADRGPAEEALERRHRAAGCLAVEAEARELIARWPESEVARRILHQAALRHREDAIAEQLAAADQAAADERFRDAARHLQAALDAGCDQPQLKDRIAEAQAQERERQQEAQVRAVSERLGTGDPQSALLAYLALAAPARTRVREREERPELGWLEELAVPRSGSRTQAAVAAVLALAAALDRVRAGDDPGALAALEPHEDVLRELGAGRNCLRSVRSRLAAAGRERARKVLAAAEEVLAGGEHVRARGLLAKVDRRDLDDEDRARMAGLVDRIRDAAAGELLELDLEGRVPTEELLPLRDQARELAARASDPAVRERWRAECEELDCRIRGALALETVDEPLPLAEAFDCGPWLVYKSAQLWLDDDGRRLVLADSWHHWIFFHVVDPASAVVTRVSVCSPVPLHGEIVGWARDGERLVMVGEAGDVFELRWGDWELVRWSALGELDTTFWYTPVRQAALLPGTPYLWIFIGEHDGIRIFDRQKGEIRRRLPAVDMIPVAGTGQVIVATEDGRFELLSDHGTRGRELRLAAGRCVVSAAASPSGSGLWALVTDHDVFNAVDLCAFEPGPGRALEARLLLEIKDAFAPGRHPMATSATLGLGFLLVKEDLGTARLVALAPSEDGVRELWQVPVPFGAVLVQDARAQQAGLVGMAEAGLGVVPLGSVPAGAEAAPPRVEPLGDPSSLHQLRRMMPHLFVGLEPCHAPMGELNRKVLRVAVELERDRIKETLPALMRKYGGDTGDAVVLCYALRQPGFPLRVWHPVLEKLVARDPEHPEVRFLRAEAAAEAGEWDDVHGLLSGLDPQGLDDGRRRHFHHLLGLTELHRGRPEAAFEVFTRGEEYGKGLCGLHNLTKLAQVLAHPSEPLGPDAPLVTRVVTACRAADQALAEGDLRAARRLLDVPAIWHAEEMIGAVRLAEVYLRTRVRTPADRFRKRRALAFFLHLYEYRTWRLREIDLPGLKWDSACVDATAKRARAWLRGSGRRRNRAREVPDSGEDNGG